MRDLIRMKSESDLRSASQKKENRLLQETMVTMCLILCTFYCSDTVNLLLIRVRNGIGVYLSEKPTAYKANIFKGLILICEALLVVRN